MCDTSMDICHMFLQNIINHINDVPVPWAVLREKVLNGLSRYHAKRTPFFWYDTDFSEKKRKKEKIAPKNLKSWCHTKRRARPFRVPVPFLI